MKKNLTKIFLIPLLGFLLLSSDVKSNEKLTLTLNDVVNRVIDHSPSAMEVESRYLNAYWSHRMHRADYLPTLLFDATLPNFNRSISGVVQPDGSEEFHERNYLRSMMGLSLRQRIPFTGGQLFISTDLERLDNFQPTEQTEFRTTPVTIGLRQPVSGFNPYRWERSLAPLRYEEARREYLKEMEQVHIEAVNVFFDAYLARINLEISRANAANSDTLYSIAKGRYNLGNIAENELLQMELSLLNAESSLAQAEMQYETAFFRLKNIIRIDENLEITLEIPSELPDFEIDTDEVMAIARENSVEMISFERRAMEAERDVAEARAGRFDFDIFAQYGLSNRSMDMENIYSNPGDQQMFRFGVQIPVLDWGRNRARSEIAESRQQVTELRVEHERKSFEHELFRQIQVYRLNKSQLEIAARADTVAQKRFEITRQRYMIGKISITDLNLAMTEQETARRRYVEALRSFWTGYYNLRRATMYDFENQRELTLPGRP
jgi:outer membrane protein